MIILLLIIDSFSRNHFFRKLPTTLKFLNGLNKESNYSVFDFKLHNVFDDASVENMVAIFANTSEKNWGIVGDDEVDYFAANGGIWNLLREQGFLTFAGIEDCDVRFPKSFGRWPNFDIITRNFW